MQVKRLKRHKKEKHTSKNDLSMKGDGEEGTERVKGKKTEGTSRRVRRTENEF